jgi:ubiquinone biosynthesis protein COQ9
MVEAHLKALDDALEKALGKHKLKDMKIRDRIKTAVLTRLQLNEPHKEVVRRTVGYLALPPNAPLSAKCLWRTVDLMWRMAGDTSTDYNYYTKRMILGGVYSTTLITWLNDSSENHVETEAFLNRRIENVMEFEKLKAKVREATKDLPDPFEILGKMRYPEGHSK